MFPLRDWTAQQSEHHAEIAYPGIMASLFLLRHNADYRQRLQAVQSVVYLRLRVRRLVRRWPITAMIPSLAPFMNV